MIDLGKSDFALLIYDEDGAFANSGYRTARAQYSIFLSHRSVGEKIAGNGEAKLARLMLLKGHMAGYGIDANAQHLGITFGKLRKACVERRKLRCSNRSPIGDMKSEYNMLLPQIIAEPHFMPFRTGHRVQFEIWRPTPQGGDIHLISL